ncbi:MAG: hypothetical protein RRC34_13990 [Lentisphaeria bacterium]|nr:hypothetical protein [Lentisphaeria bacterium]
MWFQRLSPSLMLAAALFTLCGCVRNIYVAPNAVTETRPSQAAPMTVGLLVPQAVRDTWYPRGITNAMTRKRVDVPVGNLVLDFARTGMTNAFEDFYIERYKDRRSEKGLLVTITDIQYDLDKEKVTLAVAITIENEQKTDIFEKKYLVKSDDAKPGLGIPFISKSTQTALEQNTAAAYKSFYQQLVNDIYTLTGFTPSAAPANPVPVEAADAAPPLAPPAE